MCGRSYWDEDLNPKEEEDEDEEEEEEVDPEILESEEELWPKS